MKMKSGLMLYMCLCRMCQLVECGAVIFGKKKKQKEKRLQKNGDQWLE